ncbi:uncharacterized protein LOC144882976 [Branchiostoma floridae x Branchiostoma japonicum]
MTMEWKVLLLLSVLRAASSAVIISEINADNPSIDDQEFIELYNAGSTPVSLQSFTLVLYNGETDPARAYDVITFGNDDIVRPKGYYVIGSAKVQPTPNKIFSTAENILQNGPDAVALYYGNPADFAVGMAPTTSSLVDVVIYTKYPRPTSLLEALAPGQSIVTEISGTDVSISSCNGIVPIDLSRFKSGNPTPGRVNDCDPPPPTAGPPTLPEPRPVLPPTPAVIISEVNADNVMVDDQEFIELFNLESRDVVLDNFVLVLYDGSTTANAYDVISLTGYVVKPGGYFVVGSRNVRPIPDYILPKGVNILENGPDAVALYYGYLTDYSVGMAPTADKLVDVVIYTKYSSMTSTPLLNILAPAQNIVLEGSEIDPSISRCGGFTPKVLSQFRATTPTPASANSCPTPPATPAPQQTELPVPFPPPALVISEANPEDPPTNGQEFIELYNPESRAISLDYFVLVLYEGSSPTQSCAVIPLIGYFIQPNGYFVIGSRNVQPVPDKALDYGAHIHQGGPEAIALYYGQATDYTVGMAPTSRNLIDVVIFAKASEMSNPTLATMVNVLAPGQNFITKSDAVDSSISRCGGLALRDLSMFKATYTSPARVNDCREVIISTTATLPTSTPTPIQPLPILRPNVIISEINADNPFADDQEFIELYNQENRAVALDGFVIVLFDGNSMKAYEVIPLRGQTVQASGFFTVGSGKVQPLPDIVLPREEHILQNGPDAVALYYDRSSSAYQTGMAPTAVNLADAVVYSKYRNKLDTPLSSILTTGQRAILERADIPDASISRCGGTIPRVQAMFQTTYPSPSELNDCRVLPTAPPTPARAPPRLVINEVNADNPRFDTMEFVEIYNPGMEKVSLDSVFLVLYNGNNDRAYSVINLSGYEIEPDGYFVVGSSLVVPRPDFALERGKNILQNGEDGVALYFNPSGGDNYYQIPVTANNLIDAVVYSVRFWDGSNAILNTLTPGQQALIEYSQHNAGDVDESISRCTGNDPLRLDQFKLGFVTPGRRNNCTVVPVSNYPGVILSEINVDMPSVDDQEFIELYNTEDYDVILNYFVLVLYDGASSPKAYDVISLTGQRIPKKGYFVIGTANVQPVPDVILGEGQNILQNGPDAVALYYGSPGDFTIGMDPTSLNLVDVVIYTVYQQLVNTPLTTVLAPGQNTIIESNEAQTTDKSISRCSGLNAKDLSTFQSSAPTPRAPNACSVSQITDVPTTTTTTPDQTAATIPTTTPIIIINEVNADNPSIDKQEFIELYNTENRAVLLDNFVIVLFEGNVLRKAYGIMSLAGQAVEPHGYFVIGTKNVVPKPNMVLQAGTRILQNGPDAVALYYSDPLTPDLYKLGMNPTARDLVDVVVYTKHPNVTHTPLIDVLAPGSSAVVESGIIDVSVSRCGGFVPRAISQFQATLPSPSRPNDCRPLPTPNLVINEFNADNPKQDKHEFVELYNPNDFRIPLDSVYLIFYDDDHNWAYEIIDLTGREITAKGYFVVGSKRVVPRPDYVIDKSERLLKNREDGIGLYYNPSARYYKLMPVTTEGLIDAVVYSKKVFEGTNVLLNTLTPGQKALHEDSSFNADDVDESLGRCGGVTPRELSNFALTYPTPGARNNCSSKAPKIIINEINVDNPSYDRREFIELYNKESKTVSLDSVSVVLYDGNRDKVYLAIGLEGYSIPPKGYFVIGTEGLRQTPDYQLDRFQNVIQNGEDAVALYYDPGGRYKKGMPVMLDNLIDAVVYSTREWTGSNLILKTLTPGQKPLHESQVHYPGDIDESLSRCRGTDPVTLSQFALSAPTPGKQNSCDDIPDTEEGQTGEKATAAPVTSGGTIAGAVIGFLLAVVIAALVGFYVYRRRLAFPKPVKDDIKVAYRDLGYDDGTDA